MKTKIVGLTGGIGSGKTTIARYFESLGIPVYIADDEAKKILQTPEAALAVKNAFGESVFTDALPDRHKLATTVFGQPENLKKLNEIIHPRVQNHFEEWVKHHDTEPFVIKEAAILFESGSFKDCDAVILVTAPEEIRIARVMQRDGVSREKVLQRIANQWDDDRKKALADYTIENIDSELAQVQANMIIKQLNNPIN